MAQFGTAQFGSAVFGTVVNPWTSSAGNLEWMVQVDWDRDNAFDGEIELQSIQNLVFFRGKKARIRTDGAGQEQTDKELFRVNIYDPSGRYDPTNVNSDLYDVLGATGMLCRILMVNTTSKAQAEPVFTGTLTRISYDPHANVATLAGEGMARFLSNGVAEHVYTPSEYLGLYDYLTNLTGFDDCFVEDATPRTPVPTNYWQGRSEGLALQECVRLVLARIGYPLGQYEGQTAYNLDQPDYFWMDGSSAWQILASLADGFAARLLILRDGSIFMMDRQDALGSVDSTVAPDNAQEGFGKDSPNPYETLRNKVEVVSHTRSVAPFVSTYLEKDYVDIWSSAGPIYLRPGEAYVTDVDFNINGKPAQCSQIYVDVIIDEAWEKPDKSGADMSTDTGAGIWLVVNDTVNGADGTNHIINYLNNQQRLRLQIENRNSSGKDAYLFGVHVKGLPIAENGLPTRFTLQDEQSIEDYGEKTLTIDSDWVQSREMANNIAYTYMSNLKDPQHSSLVTLEYFWNKLDLYNNLLMYELGAIIDFGDEGDATSTRNFDLSWQWLVTGQELEWLSATGQEAKVRLTFEPLLPVTVALEINNVSSALTNDAGSLSWAHTVEAGNNRLLVVAITRAKTQADGPTVSSVTYGGAALTQKVINSFVAGLYHQAAEIWYRKMPAVGTANIVITLSGSTQGIAATAVTFNNVDQTTPIGDTYNEGSGNSAWALLHGEYWIYMDGFASWLFRMGATGMAARAQDIVLDCINSMDHAWAPAADQLTLNQAVIAVGSYPFYIGVSHKRASDLVDTNWYYGGYGCRLAYAAVVVRSV